jgi:hypothetical protein
VLQDASYPFNNWHAARIMFFPLFEKITYDLSACDAYKRNYSVHLMNHVIRPPTHLLNDTYIILMSKTYSHN